MRIPIFLALSSVVGLSSQTVPASDALPTMAGLTHYSAPKFPIELRGVKAGDGDVVIAITIDAQGQVNDSVALEASNEAFARAATAAVADWRFTPVASETWPRRELVQFNFRRSGVVTTLSHAEAASEGFVSTSTAKLKTVQWHELDVEPKRIAAPMPTVSTSALDQRGNKPLMINFIIDTQGRVRVPVVTASDDPALAQVVLAAIRQWRYSPPLHNGEPVAVEATRSLVLPGAAK